VICFVPATGHVTPLLRLARLVARHSGAHVVCFLPARFERAAADFGFGFHQLEGVDQRGTEPLFAKLSRRSTFYSAFSNYQDMLDHYHAPLHETVSRVLGDLVAGLDALRPSLILTDSHLFGTLYRQLAVRSGAKLVMSRSHWGALAFEHRQFVIAFGLSNLPAWFQRLVEAAGDSHRRTLSNWRRVRHPRQCRVTETRLAALRNRTAELLGQPDSAAGEEILVTAGISTLEHRVLPEVATVEQGREILLAPLVDPVVPPLPVDLESWLDRQGTGRIVYVCFGTMLRPREAMLRRVLRGLMEADVSVLWAQPSDQRAWMETERMSHHIRCEDFAPQASLLVSGRVHCFVTHAGLGAVQEALVGGVPMFCLPFMFDQPYLASVVERLGVGLKRSRATLTRRQVTAGVRALLEDSGYRERARQLSLELRALQNAPAQTAWIDALFEESKVLRSPGDVSHSRRTGGR
jgi:UDP:flavonoid glycosyltransferase YjiC (YdhE family)